MTYRNYCMSAIKVGIYVALLVPESCIQSFDRLNVPKLIYFE